METEINEAEAIKELNRIRKIYNGDYDSEELHVKSDLILIRFLRCHGFNELADEYLKNEKHFWYA